MLDIYIAYDIISPTPTKKGVTFNQNGDTSWLHYNTNKKFYSSLKKAKN